VSAIDLHPEDLFDKARRGEVHGRELERFRAHLEQCRACRFEYMLAHECAEGASVLPGDELAVMRIRHATARALGRSRASGIFVESARSPARSRLLLVVAAAAVTVAGLTLTSALSRPGSAWRRPSFFRRETVASLWSASQPSPSPSELFAKANAAQRDGLAPEAARLYIELERAYPGLPEELVARVLLGRLLLDRLDDPRAALAQFDSYLAHPDHDALGEEAMIGRALSLERLGRHVEERTAWEHLLAAYPRSSYADPARTRLDELR
jgi:hypothetical protein